MKITFLKDHTCEQYTLRKGIDLMCTVGNAKVNSLFYIDLSAL